MENQEMKTKKSRIYLMAFVFVTVLNVVLAVYLLQISFAQTNENRFKDQQPVKIETADQNNSPLRITIIDIDNSARAFQTVNFSVQNISHKPIQGYALLMGKEKGKIMTHFFPFQSFQIGAINQNELALERENLKKNDSFLISIDYVEFEDGSAWGEDTQKQSENIAGGRTGVKAAIEQLKNLIDQRDSTALIALLEKQLVDVEVPLPKSMQSEKWLSGYRNGYKSVVGTLKDQKAKGLEELSKKLDEINRRNIFERRQKL